jgi:hypothetical protein
MYISRGRRWKRMDEQSVKKKKYSKIMKENYKHEFLNLEYECIYNC